MGSRTWRPRSAGSGRRRSAARTRSSACAWTSGRWRRANGRPRGGCAVTRLAPRTGKGGCCMPLDDAVRAWVARWVRLAEGDLAMARLGLGSDTFDVYELVGFHAQQAAEKLVKAYLARNAVEFEDQHDIDYLQRLVRRVDAALAAKIDPAAALNRYAVGTRYPGRYGLVTREQAETA